LQVALKLPAAVVAVWLAAVHLKLVHVFGSGMTLLPASDTDCQVPARASEPVVDVGVVTVLECSNPTHPATVIEAAARQTRMQFFIWNAPSDGQAQGLLRRGDCTTMDSCPS
jgi:hypothetical protein